MFSLSVSSNGNNFNYHLFAFLDNLALLKSIYITLNSFFLMELKKKPVSNDLQGFWSVLLYSKGFFLV